jgi:radical SAM/Cys-rich protein
MMNKDAVEWVLLALRDNPIATLDITGGAPEMNPHFRALVVGARAAGKRVICRTNLTIFFERGMDDIPEFYQKQGVELIASLPCYLEDNVDRLRGDGVYQKSISALRRLNSLGYGDDTNSLPLSLVYNPAGAFLAPPQGALEADYKRVLQERHGIVFTRLFALANMPVGRFRDALARSKNLEAYLTMLAAAFNPATLDNIMCRSMVSVGWDGSLYDCDFNQILGLTVASDAPHHIREFDLDGLSRRAIVTGDHCFGCTAGQGST